MLNGQVLESVFPEAKAKLTLPQKKTYVDKRKILLKTY